jgi:hypothetical protein
VAGWLERLRERVGRRETPRARRVREAIEARPRGAGLAPWLDGVRAAVAGPDGAAPDTSALALIAAEVPTDAGGDATDAAAVLGFWRDVASRFHEPWLQVRLAEAELVAGNGRHALDIYVRACEQSAELALDERERVAPLAEAEGGEVLFRWQLAELEAYLDLIPDDEDWVRERYSELLDGYRDQPERLARLYALGARIRQLEEEGVLPQAMVVRPPRKPR